MFGNRGLATTCVVVSLVAPFVLAGCGGADGTPASTTKAGKNVYDPEHNVINLNPGPAFIIRMPAPSAGSEWRMFSDSDVGGVSLQGVEQATGEGDWYFNTIGAGGGTLEFQQIPVGSDEPTDTVTYEVNVK